MLWTLQARHIFNGLRLMRSVLELQDGFPLKELYFTLLEESRKKKWPRGPWFGWMRSFLLLIDRVDVLEKWPARSSLHCPTPRSLVEMAERRPWELEVKAQRSLNRHFSSLHNKWGMPDYIRLPSKDAAMLFSLRTEFGDFRIHTGTFESLPRNERICQRCDQGTVETVHHAIMECDAYVDIRRRLVTAVFEKVSYDLRSRLGPMSGGNKLWITLLLQGQPPDDFEQLWRMPQRALAKHLRRLKTAGSAVEEIARVSRIKRDRSVFAHTVLKFLHEIRFSRRVFEESK